jgi:hypothetical protein
MSVCPYRVAGSLFRGTRVFIKPARSAVEFAIATTDIGRLDAGAAVDHGRGRAATLAAGRREAVLRGILLQHEHDDRSWSDRAYLSIVREDWRQAKAVWG